MIPCIAEIVSYASTICMIPRYNTTHCDQFKTTHSGYIISSTPSVPSKVSSMTNLRHLSCERRIQCMQKANVTLQLMIRDQSSSIILPSYRFIGLLIKLKLLYWFRLSYNIMCNLIWKGGPPPEKAHGLANKGDILYILTCRIRKTNVNLVQNFAFTLYKSDTMYYSLHSIE
jgi:hypothetical protein